MKVVRLARGITKYFGPRKRNPWVTSAGAFAGFTLIEFLVVIAILGILAAILFPVFSGTCEKGRHASCLSNLKQIGSAITPYAQAYDGRMVNI